MDNLNWHISAIISYCNSQKSCSNKDCYLWNICSEYFKEAPKHWKTPTNKFKKDTDKKDKFHIIIETFEQDDTSTIPSSKEGLAHGN